MNVYPHIKVLIINWNGEKIIKRCIESILKTNYENFSIDVIDNGSKDKSIEIITNKYPKIKIHKINSNLGFSKGYNYAFNQLHNSSFEYYLLLTDSFLKMLHFAYKSIFLYLFLVK